MLHRLSNGLLLVVLDLDVEELVFQLDAFSGRRFQTLDHFQVGHLVHEGLVGTLHCHFDLRLVRRISHRVLVAESESSGFLQRSFEGDIEVDEVVFENIGERLRVGYNTFNKVLIKLQIDLVDERSECGLQ